LAASGRCNVIVATGPSTAQRIVSNSTAS
jgi:hypothetical protein